MDQALSFLIDRTPLFYLIQSVWRDEAFSYFMATPNLLEIVRNTAQDYNPPLYYFLLHFLIQLVGKSDVELRLLSFLAHLGTVYIAYLLARKLFSERFAWFVAALFFFNPMLLLYAFEIRMYSLYAFWSILTFYFFYLRRWKALAVVSVLGLYTHSFFSLLLVSLACVSKVTKNGQRADIKKIFLPFLFYLPWLPVLLLQFIRSRESWVYPVDLQLVKSSLGNLFTGFDGTPVFVWNITFFLSLLLLGFIAIGYRRERKKALFFLFPVFLPLFLILSYSLVRRPLFVNRYLIFVTVAEIFAVSVGIWSISNKRVCIGIGATWMLFSLVANVFFVPYKRKADFKGTFQEINLLSRPSDAVYTRTPIAFLESAYYFDPNRVFVYNPDGREIPNYIGMNVVFPDISRASYPKAPARVFFVEDDAQFSLLFIQEK